MTAANTQPQPKPSNAAPMTVRPAQPPAGPGKNSHGTLTPIENHPPDEPGYGHGV
jgi:hypothetical protein